MNQRIIEYNQAVDQPKLREVCELLAREIADILSQALSKIWHGSPVWLIDDNPIVGYNLTKKKDINVLFWSGQVFTTPGLQPTGSFKAAKIKFLQPEDVKRDVLHAWLAESVKKMYNYKDIRKNRGALSLYDESYTQ